MPGPQAFKHDPYRALAFGVRQLAGAFARGTGKPAAGWLALADHSGDKSPHSKRCRACEAGPYSHIPRINEALTRYCAPGRRSQGETACELSRQFCCMNTLYLDIFSGISGDMFLGAMVDLGADVHTLERELGKLRLEGWQIHAARGQKANIEGVKIDVRPARQRSEEHTEGTTHSHAHSQREGHGHTHDRPESGRAYGAHGGPLVATSQGEVELSVFETNVPPRFRLYFHDSKGNATAPPAPATVTLETIRPGKKRRAFKFKHQGECLEAT